MVRVPVQPKGAEQDIKSTLSSPLYISRRAGICNIYILQFSLQNGTKMWECYVCRTSSCILSLCTFCLTLNLKFKLFFAI